MGPNKSLFVVDKTITKRYNRCDVVQALPDKFKDRTTMSSDGPENIHKNRYPDIKASSLSAPPLMAVVQGYKGRKTFICAQGPLPRTIGDFWRMIWEHQVTVVVMLTCTEEHGKVSLTADVEIVEGTNCGRSPPDPTRKEEAMNARSSTSTTPSGGTSWPPNNPPGCSDSSRGSTSTTARTADLCWCTAGLLKTPV
ncbi:clr-1 [Cordylochernes scorpioides]|uniref:Clr-1 n=1 Tax=Cordylochernes scorpioides TaxID=51811 RepID=A0ABY6K7H5_9ARAC|nr:clr-1 [Cordylochernes scorpioides]